MPAQSARLNRLPSYVFAVIGDRIRQMQSEGIDVVRLDIGSPDMPPPDFVVDALENSARRADSHGYGGYRGTAGFRQAVARYYQRRFGVKLDADTEVLPLIGSKEGIVNLALAFLDVGDTALIPDIGYPSYAMGTQLANGDICWLPVREETGYIPDLDSVPAEVRERARLLWANYPNNPTGATAELDFYQQAVEFCRRSDILFVSDNPYVDVTFDGYVAGSALQADGALENTIEFMSLSKSHNMAGWRIGAAVGNSQALETLLQVKSNFDSGHFKAIYDAASAALDKTEQVWIDKRNAIYQARRDRIMDTLPMIGLRALKPKASLYIWARVLDGDVESYVEQALMKAHVSLAPGGAYGPGGEGYVRLSLGTPDDRLDIALSRLKMWYASR